MFGLSKLFSNPPVKPPTPVFPQVKIDKPSIDELLERARNTLDVTDIKVLLDSAAENDVPVILELQFEGNALITIAAARIQRTSTYMGNLVVRFKDFSEEDRLLARKAMELIVGESARRFNPPHCMFFYSDVQLMLSQDGKNNHKVTQIHLPNNIKSKIKDKENKIFTVDSVEDL